MQEGNKRKRKSFNFVDPFLQLSTTSTSITQECLSESLRKISSILEEIASIHGRIINFSGISAESSEYLEIENCLFDGLIELDRIQTGNDELNQMKKEAIMTVQAKLKRLDKKLQENIAKFTEEGLPPNDELFQKNKTENVKERLGKLFPDISLHSVHLSPIEEIEETVLPEPPSTIAKEQLNQAVADIKLTRSIDKIDKNSRIEKYLLEIGQKYQTYQETSKYIIENARAQEQIESPYKEFTSKLQYCDLASPLKLRTTSAREFLTSDKIIQNYRAERKLSKETDDKEELIGNVFSGIIKTIKGFGSSFLGIFLPSVEMGNRLALKRIQMVLLHIRLLMILLILEIPFITALIFIGFYYYMPSVINYNAI